MQLLVNQLKMFDILTFTALGLSFLIWTLLTVFLWLRYKRRNQVALKGVVVSTFITINLIFVLLLLFWVIGEISRFDTGTLVPIKRSTLIYIFIPLIIIDFIIMMLWIYIPDRLDPNSWKVLWKIKRGVDDLNNAPKRERKPKRERASKIRVSNETAESFVDPYEEERKRKEKIIEDELKTAEELKKQREAEVKAEKEAYLKAQEEERKRQEAEAARIQAEKEKILKENEKRAARIRAAIKAKDKAEQARLKREEKEAKKREKVRQAEIIGKQKEARKEAKKREAERQRAIKEQQRKLEEARRQEEKRIEEARRQEEKRIEEARRREKLRAKELELKRLKAQEEIRKSQERIKKAQEERLKKAEEAKRKAFNRKSGGRAKNDYLYRCLGLTYPASQEAIKKAYRILVKKYHPDVSTEPNATKKFMLVQKAYDVLSNKAKKLRYDRDGKY